MARTTAPLFSLDASGSIANAIVFSKWRGRQYVRRHARPKNPQSPGQLGMRAMLKFLTTQWNVLKISIESAWAETAAAQNVSPINAYVSFNQRRWREFNPPTSDTAIDPGGTAPAITMALTGGQRNIVVSLTPASAGDGWGIAVFRSTSTITTPNWNNCVAIVPYDGANAVLFTDSPLTPGTYHYRAMTLTFSALKGTACADASASAT